MKLWQIERDPTEERKDLSISNDSSYPAFWTEPIFYFWPTHFVADSIQVISQGTGCFSSVVPVLTSELFP